MEFAENVGKYLTESFLYSIIVLNLKLKIWKRVLRMRIDNIIWLPHIVDKLSWKHSVTPEEVEEILFDNPLYRKVQKGHIPGENLYAALGRTESGRFLIVFFVYKTTHEALLISARDMTKKEIKQYERR